MENDIQDYGDASAKAYHNKVLLNVALNQMDEITDDIDANNRKPSKELAASILTSAVCNGDGIREIIYQVLTNLDDMHQQLEYLETLRVHSAKGGVGNDQR